MAKFVIGGKDKTGDGAPEGLPLNCRFFPLSPCRVNISQSERCRREMKINSILRWRTLVLVIL